jgi:hypothetical protein
METKSLKNVIEVIIMISVAIIAVAIICLGLLYFSESTSIPAISTNSGIVAIISAFIGILVTAAVTQILLKAQSKAASKKDREIKIYEEKILVYKEFISKIWKMVDETEESKTDKSKLRDELRLMCFDKLVFYLDQEETKELEKIIKGFDFNSSGEIDINAICKITNILQKSLGNKHDDEKSLQSLFEAFDFTPEKSVVVIEPNQKTDQKQQQVELPKQYWQVTVLQETIQFNAFKNNNWVLALIECDGEDWRTKLIEQVKPNDVIFLYQRGGAGYIGAFRALDQPFKILDSKTTYSDDEKMEYDIYNALAEGYDFASNIRTKPIAYNFMGVGYPTVPLKTISRINNPDRIKFLLNRFNGKDMDWDKSRPAGKGKFDNGKDVPITPENKDYFSEIIKSYNLK